MYFIYSLIIGISMIPAFSRQVQFYFLRITFMKSSFLTSKGIVKDPFLKTKKFAKGPVLNEHFVKRPF